MDYIFVSALRGLVVYRFLKNKVQIIANTNNRNRSKYSIFFCEHLLKI